MSSEVSIDHRAQIHVACLRRICAGDVANFAESNVLSSTENWEIPNFKWTIMQQGMQSIKSLNVLKTELFFEK